MKALRWHARGEISLDEVDLPVLLDGEVLIEVLAAGICGTDVEEWHTGPHNIPTEPHPLTGRRAPLTLGHEVVGRVVATSHSAKVDVGAHVVIDVNRSCGSCTDCRAGNSQLCERLASSGLHDDGGFAEFMKVDESMCIDAGGLPSAAAALAEPLAVAVRACRRGGVDGGTDVVVVGGGAVGLLCAYVAHRTGARVIVVEPLTERQKRAIAVGADAACGPDDAAVSVTQTLTSPQRRVVIEAAGATPATRLAIDLASRGGTVVLVGVSARELPVSSLQLALRELTLVSSLSHVYSDMVRAVEILREGGLDFTSIVSDFVPLTSGTTAFDTLQGAPSEHVKILIVPDRVWEQVVP